jgi:hypothetical protein
VTEVWREWATPIRTAANGRIEAICKNCGHFFWFSDRERTWRLCPHCAGWWHVGDPGGAEPPLEVPVIVAGHLDPVVTEVRAHELE